MRRFTGDERLSREGPPPMGWADWLSLVVLIGTIITVVAVLLGTAAAI